MLLLQIDKQKISLSIMQKEAILESAKEGIVAVDTSNIITSINEAARELLNVENKTAKELIGQSLSHFTSVSLLDKASEDRKSTRLNSSHVSISYAVFCLKKK